MKTQYFIPREVSLLVEKIKLRLVSISEIEEQDDVFFDFLIVNSDGSIRANVKYSKCLDFVDVKRRNYESNFCSRLVSIKVSKDTAEEKVSFELKNENYKEYKDLVSTVGNLLKAIR